MTAESTATLMYWSCNFGMFRGLGGLPAGRVELRGEENVSGLERPSSLAYNHPLNSRLDVPEGGIAPGVRFNLVQGDRVIAMRCCAQTARRLRLASSERDCWMRSK